jgi:Fe-S oxidoreductase
MALGGLLEKILEEPLFWGCLTCKRCSDLCPADVDFPEFLLGLRTIAREDGLQGNCTHSAIFHTVGQMMTDPEMKQNRLDWLDDDCLVSDSSDTAFFVGCIPYFDPVFGKTGTNVLEIAQSSIKILNRLGIEPQILAEERCCGHDQRWQGDVETFRLLAEINIETFVNHGVKHIVTSCPECARTLKIDYPKYVDGHKFDVKHITELIADSEMFNNNLGFNSSDLSERNKLVTYQDPCRLGRHLGVYDAPRKVIADLGLTLLEMEKSRNTSLCCGTTCWTACGQVNKKIQVERLKEAKASGAELLITSCVKCQIHFRCAQGDSSLGEDIDIEICDLITLAANSL